jgi:MFS family permease
MVRPADLPNAVALNGMAFSLARIIGPAVSGVVITAVGTGWSFLGNAAATLGVIGGLALMRPAELFPSGPLARAPGQFRAALHYVRGRADLMLPMVVVLVIGTFSLNFQISIALLAKQVFGRGADAFGFLSTMLAIGATLGAFAGTFRRRRPSKPFLLTTAIIFGSVETVTALAPTFSFVAVALIALGFMLMVFMQSANSCVQLGLEPTMRGRVMGLYVMCTFGGIAVGAPVIGGLAQAFGPRWGMLGGGIVAVLAPLILGILITEPTKPDDLRKLTVEHFDRDVPEACGGDRVERVVGDAGVGGRDDDDSLVTVLEVASADALQQGRDGK